MSLRRAAAESKSNFPKKTIRHSLVPDLYDVLQGGDGGLGQAGGRGALTTRLPLILLFLLVFLFTAGGSQVEEEGLVLPLRPLLPLGLRLSLVVQHQVRVVVTTAVGHHHGADGAGVDVLNLEKALDHVDVL